MIRSFFISPVTIIYLSVSIVSFVIAFWLVFNPNMRFGKYGHDLTGLASLLLPFGAASLSIYFMMLKTFLDSKKYSNLESGEIFPEDSFKQFYNRGRNGAVTDTFKHPIFKINIFPLVGVEYLILQISFLFVFVFLSLVFS